MNHIFIGKVTKIVQNIEAAFVKITPDIECFLPLSEVFPHGRRLVEGDEILVQVTKDAIKTKAPAVSMNVSLSGKYLVLTREKKNIGISNKISRADRQRLKALTEHFPDTEYGMIVRTNAATASDEDIRTESEQLRSIFEQLLKTYNTRTVYSCLYQSPPDYIAQIRDYGIDRVGQIVTDDKNVYDTMMHSFSKGQEMPDEWLRFYQDSMLSLCKLYSLESKIGEALQKKVWLKSGGYLVIEQTETLSVIDVNTGKFTGKKTAEDTFYKINLEAAEEAAKQIRLRNLSGMILIDFINLSEAEKELELIQKLKNLLRKDPIKSDYIDVTGLKLVELTRKKVKRSLSEQLNM